MEVPAILLISTIFILVTLFPLSILSLRPLSLNPNPNQCIRKTLPNPHSLRPDQLTVLINGYSELRISLLTTIAGSYAALPIVANVVVLWGDPLTPQETLDSLSTNFSLLYSSGAPVTVLRQNSNSLNSRFLPRRWIRTRGILICDDDVEVDPKAVEFAFKVWRVNQDRLIGLFSRSHGLDLRRKEWIYTVHEDKYSIVLTKFMMLHVEFLYFYSCGKEEGLEGNFSKLRGVVDDMHNCEDILMNFVVTDVTNKGPLLVGADRIRDWGDARNEVVVEEGEKEVDVGLSGVKRGLGEHRKRRGECIRKFHQILGRMPLRYSYGKVVNFVTEQGLCSKRGKLVPCDHQNVE
ncbi:Glycosyltransferase family protein 64 C3 [Bienertia sinuspersici]